MYKQFVLLILGSFCCTYLMFQFVHTNPQKDSENLKLHIQLAHEKFEKRECMRRVSELESEVKQKEELISEFEKLEPSNVASTVFIKDQQNEASNTAIVDIDVTQGQHTVDRLLSIEEEIFWSIIITGRKDKYGNSYLKRLINFLKSLGYLIEKYNIKAEVIITEWNPIVEEGNLIDSIDWSFYNNNLRIITVSNEIHRRFTQSHLFQVYEFIGKNVAARRARGKWLLFTNSDNIFNDQLAALMANTTSFDEKCYYRVHRIDFRGEIDETTHPSDYWRICRDTSFRIGRNNWEKFESPEERSKFWEEWNKDYGVIDLIYPGNQVGKYNMMAAGDWTAFEKVKFVELKGYMEDELYGGMDSFMLMIAGVALNMCQITLKSPYVTCHQDHERHQNDILPQATYVIPLYINMCCILNFK